MNPNAPREKIYTNHILRIPNREILGGPTRPLKVRVEHKNRAAEKRFDQQLKAIGRTASKSGKRFKSAMKEAFASK